jgi:tyrosyl-tRNA synthetase
MEKNQSVDERVQMILRNLQETAPDGKEGEEALKKILAEKEHPRIYWGTATTGKPHLGYFVPMYKIADFLAAGCEVTILFADLHAFLDNMKSDWEQLNIRVQWYQFIIKEMLKVIGVPLDKLKFVQGTDYQLSAKYTLDVYKMSALVTTDHVNRAGAEVVKQVASPLMSSLLYPILQALDEEHLGVDMQFGGVDQRKIFMFAKEHLPKVGYKKRFHLMNPLVPGLSKSGKMSSSEPLSKVDFDDTDKVILDKLKQAYSVDGQVEGNGMLAMLKYVLFRRIEAEGREFIVERPEKWGGNMTFKTYVEVEKAFADKQLASGDLKPAVARELIKLITPLRDAINANQELFLKSYPPVKAEARQDATPTTQATIHSLDLRVGKVLTAKKAERSDKLYVAEIDLGEEKPRQVVSGLALHVPLDKFIGAHVLVVANLEKKKIMGIESNGMVLTAANGDASKVVLLNIPADTPVGEKLVFEPASAVADPVLTFKRLERVIKGLKTNSTGNVVSGEHAFKTSKGEITSEINDGTVG